MCFQLCAGHSQLERSPSTMLFPSVRDAGLLVLGALIAFIPILSGAHDVSVMKQPLGPLKVTLDYGLAISWPQAQDVSLQRVKRSWLFTSHIVFASRIGDSDEANPPVSDGQLWQIAREAVDEMVADREQYGIIPGAEPTAVGILAWGNEIILSSTMKSAGHYSYQFQNGDTPVGRSLQKCQMVWRDKTGKEKQHKNRGSCVEPMAAHLYYGQNDVPLKDRKARVGTWVKVGNWKQIDPCGTDREDFWGCNLFTKDQGLRVLDTNTPPEPYTLATLAEGPVKIEQIQLCGGDPRVFVQN
ncbi:uncharacterized protein NFIA_062880 [Aspergillus fischeri NRRL 181]|uniref:Uncharacterized protein n=1 Tax=Neosartorya fischeri (strain ATCC 1020 / DSM 3700 / CBS 544.65 / FGSC A1164 / JCM 1740 / NRRL 181 / WB 181) TaxID=331117 RepID=A1D5Y3_NEOFI|nr:conserved hypothetical protein [Aspergillus fischeri NRRL 181]EAW21127.1 conserved hypothetical protein [Aspergillus fischeri NRRL 181]